MIRQVTSADSSRVVGLLEQLWPERRIEYERARKVIEKYIEEPSYRIYGYEEEGTLVGIITVSFRWALFYEGRVAIIEDLIVDKGHRERGIGKKLVRFIEYRITEASEVKAIELNSDFRRKDALEFWEKCGYSKVAFQLRKEV